MNILLINHYAGSVKHGMEYRPFYLAREWVRLGHRVTIVAGSFSHVRGIQPQIAGVVTQEDIDGIHFRWLKTPRYHGNGMRRAFNMFTFVGLLQAYGASLARTLMPDVIIASSTYPLDVFPAWRIARRARSRLVFEVHDLWPLSPIELGGMSRHHPFIVLLQLAEDFAYRQADRVVSMLPNAQCYMQGRGMAEHKFAYVPNGIDVAEWQNGMTPLPAQHDKSLARLRHDGRFLVGYVGAHGTANALDSLLSVAAGLTADNLAIVLVGHGPEKARLEQQARERKLTNVSFLPSVARGCIPSLLSHMDALFIGLRNTPLFRYGVSPNKLMDYMMAAKPVIVAIDTSNDIVAESGCGISIPPEDPVAIGAAIRHLMKLPAEVRDRMGARGKSYVMTYHDYRKLAAQFIEVMS